MAQALTTFVVTATYVVMTRRTTVLLLVIEETDDAAHPPTLPPFPAVEATGETVSETSRPLAKGEAMGNVVPFRRSA